MLRIDLESTADASNNWVALGKRIPQSKKGGHVIIKKIILTNLNINVHEASLFTGPVQTHFDRLEFDNIESENGFPTAAVIQMIFENSGMGNFVEELFGPNGILFPLKLFGI